jgi:adenylate cyclase, class 2
MAIEVEQKFHVHDSADLERRLRALGARQSEIADQTDQYFAHPGRSFAQTDEALRLRRIGELNFITYKGPKLDATTKTRLEIEIGLAPGQAAAVDAAELLWALGFATVAEVSKRRRDFSVTWQGQAIGVSLDEVAEVGDFVELEIVTSPADVERARQLLASLAADLDLRNGERRSYLELLLAARGAGGQNHA